MDETTCSAFLYRDGEWSDIRLPWPSGKDSVEHGELEAFWGYYRSTVINLGGEYGYLWAQVHGRDTQIEEVAPGEFLVEVCTHDNYHYVICPRLPDLLRLLESIAPSIQVSMETAMAEERERAKR